MKNLDGTVVLLAAILVAGCQAAPEKTTATSAANPAAAPSASARAPRAAAARPFTGYRRYRGTVGGQPVVVELTISAATKGGPAQCQGQYYYERHGGALQLAATPYRANGPLVLAETLGGDGQPALAHWQAQQAAGPALTGTWTSAKGRRLPFALHEDYAGAVRYEIVTVQQPAAADADAAAAQAGDEPTSPVTADFLHLLGPDTLRPALRKLQCPPPAQRRPQEGTASTFINVTLNGYGLLSTCETSSEDIGGAYPDNHRTLRTYDVATGQLVDPEDWLLPGHDLPLRRLLTRRLQADSVANYVLSQPAAAGTKEATRLAKIPGFGLNSAGLYFVLEDYGVPHVIQGYEVTIPYAELLPLLRPGSPVASMLRERGLWRMPKRP